MRDVDATGPRAIQAVRRRLERVRPVCAWTEGRWPELDVTWDGLQNTSQDKRRLGALLVKAYAQKPLA